MARHELWGYSKYRRAAYSMAVLVVRTSSCFARDSDTVLGKSLVLKSIINLKSFWLMKSNFDATGTV